MRKFQNVFVIALFLNHIVFYQLAAQNQPIESYMKDSIPSATSKINLPILIDLIEMEKTINRKITGTIYEDLDMSNNDNDQLMVKAVKSQDITIKSYNQNIQYKVPLKLWIKKGVMGMTDIEAEGEIAIVFSTNFSVQNDWTMKTETSVLYHDWISAPVMKTRLVDIPIRYVADIVLNRSKAKLSTAIDNQVKQTMDLKKTVNDVWTSIQTPQLMSEDYKAWSKITPKEISMTPFLTQNNDLKTVFSVIANTDIQFGDAPKFRANSTLPNLSYIPQGSDDFNINLVTDISFSEAEAIAKNKMVGQTFGSGKQAITVEDILIFGQNDNLIIHTKVKGFFDGNVYMKGKPVYNPTTQAVEISNLDFELNTKNFLAKSANWLFHKGLVNKMNDAMKFPVADKINEAQTDAQKKLENYAINNNITLKGKIEKTAISDLLIIPEGIRCVIQSDGRLNIYVKGMD